MYIYIYTYIYIYIYIYIYLHVYIYIYIHVHIYIYTCIHLYIYTHIHLVWLSVFLHSTYVCIFTSYGLRTRYVYIYIDRHIRMYVFFPTSVTVGFESLGFMVRQVTTCRVSWAQVMPVLEDHFLVDVARKVHGAITMGLQPQRFIFRTNKYIHIYIYVQVSIIWNVAYVPRMRGQSSLYI